jgi:hypothetical protein
VLDATGFVAERVLVASAELDVREADAAREPAAVRGVADAIPNVVEPGSVRSEQILVAVLVASLRRVGISARVA